jgi:Transposase IS116/IS110/IS902 family
MQARNAALNQLSALLVTAPDHTCERLGALAGERLARAAARLRPSGEVMNGVLRRVGRRAERLTKEAEAERALAALVAELAPTPLEECGVGPVCSAQLLASSGDPSRMKSEASFAALAGTSPGRRLERKAATPPTQPRRRPPTQLGPPRHRPPTDPPPRRDQHLLPAATRRRQDHERGKTLRQARTRPPLLPTPQRAADAPLDNIEASEGYTAAKTSHGPYRIRRATPRGQRPRRRSWLGWVVQTRRPTRSYGPRAPSRRRRGVLELVDGAAGDAERLAGPRRRSAYPRPSRRACPRAAPSGGRRTAGAGAGAGRGCGATFVPRRTG